MKTTFTTDDLILYIYRETSETMNQAIEKALQVDEELQEQFRNLKMVTDELGSAEFNPHDTSLKIIMEESSISQSQAII